MYLIVLDYVTGNIDIIRNIPEDIDDIEEFVSINLGYHLSEISYMTIDEDDSMINIFDYKNEKLISKGYDYVSQKY